MIIIIIFTLICKHKQILWFSGWIVLDYVKIVNSGTSISVCENCHLGWRTQREKKDSEKDSAWKESVFNSPGLVDFGFGLVNSVLNLPDGQVNLGKLKLQKDCNQYILLIKKVFWLAQMAGCKTDFLCTLHTMFLKFMWIVKGGCNIWVWGWNPKAWPFAWKLY